MKKGSTIPLLLASFAIVCLVVLAGFVTFLNMYDVSSASETPPAATAAPESESDMPTQILKPSAAVTTDPFDEAIEEPEHSYIFVGDSRTVGMQNALADDSDATSCRFIAKSGEGFYWLYHDGIVELEEALKSTPYATVIFNLGVNDLEETDRYISFYKTLFSEYHDPSFYIMSVNPVDDERCSGASNAEIQAFNEKMKAEFPDKYLDCYNYLLSQDFATSDGLHYPNRVYRMVHHFAVMSLNGSDNAS
ncbi:SGNH/GDSL hydrolase family protein [Lachnospiraceae bacterium 46-15]